MNRLPALCNYMGAAAAVLIKFVRINASAPILTLCHAQLTSHIKKLRCDCCEKRTHFSAYTYICACNGVRPRSSGTHDIHIFIELAALYAPLKYQSQRECVTLAAGWTRPFGIEK